MAMTIRYRLKLATWTVVRETGQPSPRKLNGPTGSPRSAGVTPTWRSA